MHSFTYNSQDSTIFEFQHFYLKLPFLFFSGTFRWSEAKDVVLLREVRIIEPYLCKVGSKEAGQKWSELALHLNEYDGFREHPRDQRSVREHFNKLVTEFKRKVSVEENSTGTSPAPPTEKDILIEEIVNLMESQPIESDKKQQSEREKALDIRDQAMTTWSKSHKGEDKSDVDSNSETEISDKPKRKRPRKKRRQTGEALKYLEARSAQEANIRKEELQFRREQNEMEQERIQLERAKLDQMQQQMQLNQQQLVTQQQSQAEYQKQQLKLQENLIQQQMQSQNLMIALLGKLANKE